MAAAIILTREREEGEGVEEETQKTVKHHTSLLPTHSHHSHCSLCFKRARFKYHITTRSNFSRLPPCYPSVLPSAIYLLLLNVEQLGKK